MIKKNITIGILLIVIIALALPYIRHNERKPRDDDNWKAGQGGFEDRIVELGFDYSLWSLGEYNRKILREYLDLHIELMELTVPYVGKHKTLVYPITDLQQERFDFIICRLDEITPELYRVHNAIIDDFITRTTLHRTLYFYGYTNRSYTHSKY